MDPSSQDRFLIDELGTWDAEDVYDYMSSQPPEMFPELQEPPEPQEPQGSALGDAVASGSAASFIAFLRQSTGAIPESARPGLIHLLEQYQTIAASNRPAAAQTGNVRLIQGGIIIPNPALGDDGKSSFPHIVELNGALSAEDEVCEWQQYKTKTTHITVQLQDEQGQPVRGDTLQPGGLELQLTLLNATTMQPLSDIHKPEKTRTEGLLAETKAGKKVRLELPLTVRLTESCYTFKFFVLLLSSDVSGALMKIKVAPPNADAGDPLCVITRAFKSRARSNLHEVGSKRPRSPENNSRLLRFTAVGGDDGPPEFTNCGAGDDGPPQFTSCGAGADEGLPPCFRSLGADDGEAAQATGRTEDEGDGEEQYEHEEEDEEEARLLAQEREKAHALGRKKSQTHVDQAHTVDELQILLSALKTGSGPLPDGATLFRVLQRNSRR